MENAINAINAIIADVRDNWKDNRGGTTWAASNIIRIGNAAIKDILNAPAWSIEERSSAIEDWWVGCFNSETGAESDICSITQAAIAASGEWN